MRKLKFGLLMIAILICAFSISGFSISNIIDPFGTFSNLALTRTDGTALIKISPTVDLQLSQNLFNMDNLNALLNEEEITLDATNMQSALENGMHLALPLEIGAYAHLNLFGLHLVPYLNASGSISVNLPQTFSQILFGNTLLESNVRDTVNDFAKSNLRLNLGVGAMVKDFFVTGNFFVPVLYSDPERTYASASYTSSASPANVNVEFDAQAVFVGALNLQGIDTRWTDSTVVSQELMDVLSQDAGISLSLGYGNDKFGFAVNDITIRPASARYAVNVSANGSANYTAEGTDITADATYTISDPEFSSLLTPMSVTNPINVTAYYKSDGFFMWGATGMYSLSGSWAAKAYAGLNLEILKVYYILGVIPGFYSNGIGLEVNLGLLNADLQVAMTTDSLNPLGSSTPGLSAYLKLSGGI
mgnify:FL=1